MLVAAIGNAWLKDQAFGIRVLEQLRTRGVPEDVDVVDWSFGTIAAFQKLSERSYRRAIFITAMTRGRPRGTLHRSAPQIQLPSPEEIHARVGDCVMGCVTVDNLLILGKYYGRLPHDVVLIEAEPADETWDAQLSPEVEGLLDAAVAAALEEIGRSSRRV